MIDLETYLRKEPRARERKNKNRAIGNLLMKEFGIKLDKDLMTNLVLNVNKLDRTWRKLLEKHPELRGSDYAEKDELEVKAINEINKI